MRDLKLTIDEIKAIESVLSKDDRVMVIPTKDRLKIMRVRQEEVKLKTE